MIGFGSGNRDMIINPFNNKSEVITLDEFNNRFEGYIQKAKNNAIINPVVALYIISLLRQINEKVRGTSGIISQEDLEKELLEITTLCINDQKSVKFILK